MTTCGLLEEQRRPTLEMVQNLVKIELAYINTNHPDFWKAVPALTSIANNSSNSNNYGNMLLNRSSSSEGNDHNGDHNGEEEVAMKSIQASVPSSPKAPPGLFSYLFRSHALSPSSSIPTPITTSSSPIARHQVKQQKRPLDAANSHAANSRIGILTEKEEFETQLIMTLIHSYFGIVRKNLMDTVPKSIMHFLVNATLDNLPAKLVGELYREELLGELLREDEGVKGKRVRIRRELEAYRRALSLISSQLSNDPNYRINSCLTLYKRCIDHHSTVRLTLTNCLLVGF